VNPMERLASVDHVRGYQRAWLQRTREHAERGEPFVICQSDEFEEVLGVLGIPVLVINYWNYVVTAQRKSAHFTDVLEAHGYPGPHFFGLGFGTSLDPGEAPWGGLPKPLMILGSTRNDFELRTTELWARELGCECYPLEFNFASAHKRIPPEDWWRHIRTDWPALVDPSRTELRHQQNSALVRHIKERTGRTFTDAELATAMERVNDQMDLMTEATELIGAATPCPVSFRDQLAAYQMMWHRGTEAGIELATRYLHEVRERVGTGQGAYPTERLRVLMWSMSEEPAFHQHLRDRYGAVIVGSPYAAMPATYAREVHGDPLRALSARQTFLFDMRSTSWMIREARRQRADVVIGVETTHHRSRFRIACESAGFPYLAVPTVSADADNLAALDAQLSAAGLGA
jgi:benzoyl-CoA reductase subunit B